MALDKRELVVMVTHAELLMRDGRYAEPFNLQAARYPQERGQRTNTDAEFAGEDFDEVHKGLLQYSDFYKEATVREATKKLSPPSLSPPFFFMSKIFGNKLETYLPGAIVQ